MLNNAPMKWRGVESRPKFTNPDGTYQRLRVILFHAELTETSLVASSYLVYETDQIAERNISGVALKGIHANSAATA